MSAVHDELEHEYEDLQSRLGDPDLIADQAAYAKAAKRYNELEQIVECIRNERKLDGQRAEAGHDQPCQPATRGSQHVGRDQFRHLISLGL